MRETLSLIFPDAVTPYPITIDTVFIYHLFKVLVALLRSLFDFDFIQ